MRALSLVAAGDARIVEVPDTQKTIGDLLLRVEMVGLCGTDLNSFRGNNPLITYPRILGHEIPATVLVGTAAVPTGAKVTLSPYTHCGLCPSCRRGRFTHAETTRPLASSATEPLRSFSRFRSIKCIRPYCH